MQPPDKAQWALLSVFPTVESLKNYAASRANLKTLHSFIDWAARHQIIAGKNEQDLVEFIGRQARPPEA